MADLAPRNSKAAPTSGFAAYVVPKFLASRTLRSGDASITVAASNVRHLLRSLYYTALVGVLVCSQLIFSILMVDGRVDPISSVAIGFSATASAIFAADIVLRVFGFRLLYVRSWWFGLDVFTVVAGTTNVVTRIVLLARDDATIEGTSRNVLVATNAIMNLRLLRSIRFFENFRRHHWFHGLWFVSRAIFAALKVICWISGFLLGIIVFYGMIGSDLIGNNEFLRNYPDDNVSALVEEKFFSTPISMLTVFQIITLDSWSSQIAGPLLLAQSNDATAIGRFRLTAMIFYFISVVATGALIVLNILNAIIVERSIQYGRDDDEANFATQQAKMRKLAKDLHMAFVEADVNGDNSLTLDELMATCDNPRSKTRLLLLQLGTKDEVMRLFTLLDANGDGELGIEEFCDGFLRCKQDFNKFFMWQIWERQRRDQVRLAEMHQLLLGTVSKSKRGRRHWSESTTATTSGSDWDNGLLRIAESDDSSIFPGPIGNMYVGNF